MAGSYNHVVKEDGSLRPPDRICGMLECMSGDVVECVEEMYGMIWYLAKLYNESGPQEIPGEGPEVWIEEARQNYKAGLKASPTKRYQKLEV